MPGEIASIRSTIQTVPERPQFLFNAAILGRVLFDAPTRAKADGIPCVVNLELIAIIRAGQIRVLEAFYLCVPYQ
jgi:hypothetical protein